MLLVYTHKITPRVTYIFRHIFENMLELAVGFTSSIEAFVTHSGPKMSYTHKPLGDEFFVAAHSLLFERGLGSHEPSVQDWEGIPAFFKTSNDTQLPFDIFAASFFLLSRYEELTPHLKTAMGVFDPLQSIAAKQKFLNQPLVDVWALKLHKIMSAHFEEIKPYKLKTPQKEVLIDVPLAFKYRHRSVLVALEVFFKSLWSVNLVKILTQLAVLLRLEEDPYDSFSVWEEWFNTSSILPKVFFLYANSSAYESNVSTLSRELQLRIKRAGDSYSLGLLLSVQSQLKPEVNLAKEKKDFQGLTHRQVKMSRIPISYRQLSDVYADLVPFEFTEDYSMGYADQMGFRASTATPYYFYDLTNEFQLPIKIYPVAAKVTGFHSEKTLEVFNQLEELYKKLPLTSSKLIIAISNGFLDLKKQDLPLQKAFKKFIK
jgi:hypothetical protein